MISFGASLTNIGFFNKARRANKTNEPKKFLKKENSAGPEKTNADFINGMFEPHIIESKSSPVIAKFFFYLS